MPLRQDARDVRPSGAALTDMPAPRTENRPSAMGLERTV